MSVNITVNGRFAKHCGKSALLEDPERKKKELLEERRKQRIVQVRAESKNIAKKIRTDVAQQRERLQRDFDQQCAKEQERLKQQAIAQAHHDYRSAIFQVGTAHRAAFKENQQKATILAAKKQTYEEFKRQQSQRGKCPVNKTANSEKKSCFKEKPSVSVDKSARIAIEQNKPHCNCCPCNDDEGETSSDICEGSCEISSTELLSECENELLDETVIPAPCKKSTQTITTKLSRTPAVILDVDVEDDDVVEIVAPSEMKDNHTGSNRQFCHVIRISPERKHSDKDIAAQRSKNYNSTKCSTEPIPNVETYDATDSSEQNSIPNASRKPRFTQVSDLIGKKGQLSKTVRSPPKLSPRIPQSTLRGEKSPAQRKLPPRTSPQKPVPKSTVSPTRNLGHKPTGSTSPSSKPTTTKSPSLSSRIRKPTSSKSPNSSSPVRTQLSKTLDPKSPSSVKAKTPITNKNADSVSMKSSGNPSTQTFNIGTDLNGASGSGQVQFYDYNNKFKKAYPQPATMVHIQPTDRSQPNAMDQARIERQLQQAREAEIECLRKKSEERGQKALEREQVRRDCNELTEKLDALTKQHAQSMPSDPCISFTTGNAQKETKMNAALEDILMRPAIITCPQITRPTQTQRCINPSTFSALQPNKVPLIDPSSLNLGEHITTSDMDNSTPSSESCRSILLGYCNDQSKQIRDDLSQYEANPRDHQQKANKLKSLLQRINKLRDALLLELQSGGAPKNETENIQKMIDSLCNMRQERENIVIDGLTGKSRENLPQTKKTADKNSKDPETNIETKRKIAGTQEKTSRENSKTNLRLQEREKLLQEKEAILESKLKEFFRLQKNCKEIQTIETTKPKTTEENTCRTTVLCGDKPLEIVVNVKCDTGTGTKTKSKTAEIPRKETKIIHSPNAIKKKKSNANIAKQKLAAIQRSHSYDSHSTAYHSLPPEITNNVKNLVHQDTEVKVPHSTTNNDDNTIVQLEQQPMVTNPVPRKETKRPPANINPLLAQYIQRLLGMSRNSVNALGVSSSSLETPSSSIINVTTNKSDMSDSERLSSERLERVQKFISDNYSFVNELEESLKTETSICLEDCIKKALNKIWKQRLRENEECKQNLFEKEEINDVYKKPDQSTNRKPVRCDPKKKQETEELAKQIAAFFENIISTNQSGCAEFEKSNEKQKASNKKISEKPQRKDFESTQKTASKDGLDTAGATKAPTTAHTKTTGISQRGSIDSMKKTSKAPKLTDTLPDKTQRAAASSDIIVLDDTIVSTKQNSVLQKSNNEMVDKSNSSLLSSFYQSKDDSRVPVQAQKSVVVDSSGIFEGRSQRNSKELSQISSHKSDQRNCRNSEYIEQTTTSVTVEQQTSSRSNDQPVVTVHNHQVDNESQIQRYAQLTENCNQRIAELTDLINKVREEKQKILENTLSSVSDNVTQNSTEYKDLPPKSTDQTSQPEKPSTSKGGIQKKATRSQPASSTEVSQSENLPLEKNKPTSGSRDSGISVSRPETSQDVHSETVPQSIATSKTSHKSRPPPILNRFSPQLLEDEVGGHELSTILEVDTPATSRVTMPESQRNATTVASTSSIKQFPTYEAYTKMLNLDLTKLDKVAREQTQAEYKLLIEALIEAKAAEALVYPTFEEYAKHLNLDLTKLNPDERKQFQEEYQLLIEALNEANAIKTAVQHYPTFQEYATQLHLNLTEIDAAECSRVRKEYKSLIECLDEARAARNAKRAFPAFEDYTKQLNLDLTAVSSEESMRLREKYNSLMECFNQAKAMQTTKQPFPTFEEYANQLNLDLTVMDPEESLRVREKYNSFIEALQKAKVVKNAIKAFPTFEEYVKKQNIDLTVMNPEQKSAVHEQHKDLFEAYVMAKTKSGAMMPVPLMTFEEYANKMSMDVSKMDPEKVVQIKSDYNELVEAITDAKAKFPMRCEGFKSFNAFIKQLSKSDEDCLLSLSDASSVVADKLIESLQLASMQVKSKKQIACNTPRDTETCENTSSTTSSDTDSESIRHIERELRRRNILRGSFIVPIDEGAVFQSTAQHDIGNPTAFQHMLLAESGLERISSTDSHSGDFEKELLSVGINLPTVMRKKRKETETLSTTTTSTSGGNRVVKPPAIKITYAEANAAKKQVRTPASNDSSDSGAGNRLNLRDFLTKELEKHGISSSATGSSVEETMKKEFFRNIIESITTPSSDSPQLGKRRPIDRQKTSTPISSHSSSASAPNASSSTSSQLFSGESHLSSVRFLKKTTTHYYPKAKYSDQSVNTEAAKDANQCDKSTRYIPKPKAAPLKNQDDDVENSNVQQRD